MIDICLYHYKAEVIDIYDGDTIRANLDLGFGFVWHEMKFRLHGLDAPEVRGEERHDGLIARDALRVKLAGQDVVIETIKDKTGKYGRYLAIIWVGEENINQWLIDQGYAVAKEY